MADEFRIPLPELLQTQLGVYADARAQSTDVQRIAREALASRASGRMREALAAFLDKGLAKIACVPRGRLPDPPADLLRAMGAGTDEWSRYESATHVVFVGASYTAAFPPFHHWLTVAAASAIAEQLDGVVLDPVIPRLLPLAHRTRVVPEDGRVVVVRDVIAPMSRQRDGTTLITTKGMSRFGLAEMAFAQIPPNVGGDALPLVNAVAQRLLRELYTRANPDARALVLAEEVSIDMHDVAAAHGKRLESASTGATTVRLSFVDGGSKEDSFVVIDPPRAFRGQRGEWVNAALAALVGTEPQPALAHRPHDDDALRRATERAKSELSSVRARVATGLPPGARLFVKRGFPIQGGPTEFMWVAVTRWSGERIEGSLANESSYDASLRTGHSVAFADGEVTDWMIRHDDGRMEGGYSIAALSH